MSTSSASADEPAAPVAASSGVEAQGKQHCVRCHANFSAGSNASGNCVVPHVFDASQAFDFGDGQHYFPSHCCGDDEIVVQDTLPSSSRSAKMQQVEEGKGTKTCEDVSDAKAREEGEALFKVANLGPCFRGRHTIVEDDIEMQYNGWNILRCVTDEEGRCMRVHLAQSDNEPVFSAGVIYTTGDAEDREWADEDAEKEKGSEVRVKAV